MPEQGIKVQSGTPVMGVDPATGLAYFLQVNANGQLVMGPGAANVTIGRVDHTTTGIGHGKKIVTTAGTPVVLAAATPAKWVTIQAYRANTGLIAVGGTGVNASATINTGTGVTLAAGESITLAIDDLADVFIDASVSTEGVRYTYGT